MDSDDIVPAYAYAVMVAALDESGSDLVVGSLKRRFDETGELVEPGFLRGVHQKRRLRVTIEEFPEVMRSVFACNKVFRTSFWHGERLSFPEGVRYEDQPTIIEAYLRAGAIDVLRRPVYHWRIRADRSSITQRRHEVEDLRDRITTKLMTTQVVRSLGSPGLLDYWARNSLAGDMPHYFREIPGCSDDYWEVLRDGMSRMFDRLPPVWQSQLRVVHRLAGWLVVQNRRQDAERLLAYVIGNPGLLPLRVDGDHVVALLPSPRNPIRESRPSSSGCASTSSTSTRGSSRPPSTAERSCSPRSLSSAARHLSGSTPRSVPGCGHQAETTYRWQSRDRSRRRQRNG
ncbi:MAG: hypothetical protein WKF76_05305 [Nocardioidaceae bacterium]